MFPPPFPTLPLPPAVSRLLSLVPSSSFCSSTFRLQPLFLPCLRPPPAVFSFLEYPLYGAPIATGLLVNWPLSKTSPTAKEGTTRGAILRPAEGRFFMVRMRVQVPGCLKPALPRVKTVGDGWTGESEDSRALGSTHKTHSNK